VLDQLGHGRIALGQPPQDSKAIDVGEGLVEQADGAQVVWLVDDRGDRGANPGG
jgi:hypothetical protein